MDLNDLDLELQSRDYPICRNCSRGRQLTRRISLPVPIDTTGGWGYADLYETEWICAETGIAMSRELGELEGLEFEQVAQLLLRGIEQVTECAMFRQQRQRRTTDHNGR